MSGRLICVSIHFVSLFLLCLQGLDGRGLGWRNGQVDPCVCVHSCMVYKCMCVHACACMCVLYSSCSSDFGVSVTLPGPSFMLFPWHYPRALFAHCLLPTLSSWNRFPRAPALPTRSTPCSFFHLGPVGLKRKGRCLGIMEPAAR